MSVKAVNSAGRAELTSHEVEGATCAPHITQPHYTMCLNRTQSFIFHEPITAIVLFLPAEKRPESLKRTFGICLFLKTPVPGVNLLLPQ